MNLTGNTKTLLKPSKLEIIHFMTIFVSEIKIRSACRITLNKANLYHKKDKFSTLSFNILNINKKYDFTTVI